MDINVPSKKKLQKCFKNHNYPIILSSLFSNLQKPKKIKQIFANSPKIEVLSKSKSFIFSYEKHVFKIISNTKLEIENQIFFTNLIYKIPYVKHNKCSLIVEPKYDYSLENYNLNMSEKTHMISCIVRNLFHLHSLSILHNNINMNNIVKIEDDWKLINFSYSKLIVDDDRDDPEFCILRMKTEQKNWLFFYEFYKFLKLIDFMPENLDEIYESKDANQVILLLQRLLLICKSTHIPNYLV
ncbi:hypothetical protein JO84_gp257 [Aureococcus anophagefferens virus]|uniref:Protein kinase domain-containing protein n=1 Tax=Aureococcus anophagefferens virus TaxID=1474867 RepID=A0A076FMF1_9VIRU|nr:hypothetical protein JO84_gp257 [Aureococcus anophagefferens virus]AII17083.1 hypothetical protein AaV_218 [Aureococcus anophagefferens virus]UOG94132.1 hypothetical protein MKD35_91 [Aureococcus anophagefferens virus]